MIPPVIQGTHHFLLRTGPDIFIAGLADAHCYRVRYLRVCVVYTGVNMCTSTNNLLRKIHYCSSAISGCCCGCNLLNPRPFRWCRVFRRSRSHQGTSCCCCCTCTCAAICFLPYVLVYRKAAKIANANKRAIENDLCR